jgi:hypothetical protein
MRLVVSSFWLPITDGGLVLIASKDIGRDWLLAGRHLHQFVGCFIESSRNVIEFEAVKLVL